MRSICIINQCYTPDLDATGQMMTDLAEDLAKSGLKVSVIAGRNDRRLPKKETIRGVDVIRVGVLRLNKKILPFRYLNYISFFPQVFIKVLFRPKSDCLFILSSPPFMYFLGWMLKTIKRSKLILNVQDLYPDVAVKLGLLKNRSLIKSIESLTLKIYQKADLVICIGSKMSELLLKRGVAPAKLKIVDNWSDAGKIKQINKSDNPFIEKNGLDKKFIIQYSGNIGMVHEIDTIIKAAQLLKENQDIVFLFIGDGVQAEKIKYHRDKDHLKNIVMLPYQKREMLGESLNAADVSLVTLKSGFGGLVVPSKIYGVMAAGKPVLAVCPKDSEVAEIVKSSECGFVIEPGDHAACADAIKKLYFEKDARLKMGENARAALQSKFDRPISTNKYYLLISQLLENSMVNISEPEFDVSICLVSHNASQFTLQCLKSIHEKTKQIKYEVILADNDSSDNTVGAVQADYPQAQIIKNEKNIGFTAANNRTIKMSRGKYILLLNNDTVLKNQAVDLMANKMKENERIGILACKLHGADGRIQRNCRSFYRNPFDTMFGRASLLSKLFPNNPITRRNILSDWDYNSPRQVDWVSGACLMIRREVFNQIGLLDENFFMYWEDTDFCKRARDAGWEIWYTPEGEITHYSGQGGGKRSIWLKLRTIYQMHYSAYYYFRKHHYKNPLHPMAIMTFLGMLILVAFKSIHEVFLYSVKRI